MSSLKTDKDALDFQIDKKLFKHYDGEFAEQQRPDSFVFRGKVVSQVTQAQL